jgi:hypothetical protein
MRLLSVKSNMKTTISFSIYIESQKLVMNLGTTNPKWWSRIGRSFSGGPTLLLPAPKPGIFDIVQFFKSSKVT